MSRFRFVYAHRASYEVERLCQSLGVSRSGLNARATRGPAAHAQRDAELAGWAGLVVEVHSRFQRTYGPTRVHAGLGRLGHATARKHIAPLMREGALVGAHPRRTWRNGKPNTAWAPDLPEREGLLCSRPHCSNTRN